MAPLRNRSTRTGANEVDVLDGLPVRQWRYTEALVGPPPVDTLTSTLPKSRWPPHPLPRDAHLLPEHSQQLLRLARAGAALKRPAEGEDDDKENGATEPEEESKEISQGFTAKKWTLVPRNLEEPEVEYLAKRRKGLPPLYSVYGGVVGPLATTGAMRKTKVRRLDNNGVAHVYEVLAPEGQKLDGEIVEESEAQPIPVEPAALPGTIVEGIGVVNAEGIVVSNDLLQPTPNRRKPPPPRKKKKSGPGRGHKKVLFKAEDGTIIDSQTPTRNALGPGGATDGEGTPLPASTPGEGDTPMPDAQDDEEEEGSEDGEEGDDDEEKEDGELPQSPLPEAPGAPEITPAVPVKAEMAPSSLRSEVTLGDTEHEAPLPAAPLADAASSTTIGTATSNDAPTLALQEAAIASADTVPAASESTLPPLSSATLQADSTNNVEAAPSSFQNEVEAPAVEPLDVSMSDVPMVSEAPIQSLPTAVEDTTTASSLPVIDAPAGTMPISIPAISSEPLAPIASAQPIDESTTMPPASIPGLGLPPIPPAPVEPISAPTEVLAPTAPSETADTSNKGHDIFGNLELELDRSSQNPSAHPAESLLPPPPSADIAEKSEPGDAQPDAT